METSVALCCPKADGLGWVAETQEKNAGPDGIVHLPGWWPCALAASSGRLARTNLGVRRDEAKKARQEHGSKASISRRR